MAEYLIQGDTLTAIADAIRSKTNTTETIDPTDMPAAINGIADFNATETTINIDFTNGDMVVIPSSGTVFSEVNIPQPSTLISSNIVKGVTIAGVEGTYEGSTSSSDSSLFSDINLKYFTYFIDNENNEIVLSTVRYDVLYADTGSYDVTIPDTIAGFNVVIRST